MSIYQFGNYRAYMMDHFRKQEGGARGQFAKLAAALGVHSTFVSLVFNEKRDLSLEQAALVASEFRLTEPETDYFLNLVSLARAGNPPLKKHIEAKIALAQAASKKLETRYAHERKLAAGERQVFYSSWHYSAIRVFTSTDERGRTIEEMCLRFRLPREIIVEACEFLQKAELIIANGDRYKVGPQRTFLEKGHPLLKCHHNNWRQKALNQYEELTDDEMMFTTTLSLSRRDFASVREKLAEFIKETNKAIETTDPEEIGCLNIDLFFIR